MKKVLYTLLVFSLFVIGGQAQISDVCSTSGQDSDPDGSTINLSTTGMSDESNYVPSTLVAPLATQFYTFTSPTVPGMYTMTVSAGTTAPGDISIGLGTDCNLGDLNELVEPFGSFTLPYTISFCAAANADYIIVIASEAGTAGDVDIAFEFDGAVIDAMPDVEVCHDFFGNPFDFTGLDDDPTGENYIWTTPIDVGFGTTGTNDIASWTADNTTAADIVATVTVTPYTYGPDGINDSGANDDCTGTPITFDVTVFAEPVANQELDLDVCHDEMHPGITFTGTPADDFVWTSDLDVGFGLSGSSIIPAWTGVNATPGTTLTATVTVTPYTYGPDGFDDSATGDDCLGTPMMFEIDVHGLPVINDTDLFACEVAFANGDGSFILEDADGIGPQNTGAAGPGNVGLDVDNGAADMTVTYHATMMDADMDMNPLSSPYLGAEGDIVFARVEDDITGCFDVAEVTLHVILIPDVDPFMNFTYCNNEVVGDDYDWTSTIGTLMMTNYQWSITNDIGFGASGVGVVNAIDIVNGWTAVNTGGAPITETVTVIPYSFGPDGLDNGGLGDDCIDGTNVLVFDITVNPSPANDDCGAADEVLSMGLNAAYTNECASLEVGEVVGSCMGATEDATVWFTYTVVGSNQMLTLDLAPGTMMNGFFAAYSGGCSTTEEGCDAAQIIIDCVQAGDVITIQVASPLVDGGTFDLTVTETGVVLTNNDCATAEDPTSGVSNFSNICASSTTTDCSLDATSHDVWYTYTPTAMPVDITINVSADGANGTPATDVSVGVFFDGCGLTGLTVSEDPNSGTPGLFCNSLGTDNELFCISDPITFFVGSLDTEEGDFTITITESSALPPNDLCANAENALTTTELTNFCADPESTICGLDGATSHDVWYTIPLTNDPADVTINVSPAGGATDATDVSVGVYLDCVLTALTADNDPANTPPGEFCSTLGADMELFCVAGGTLTFVVASPDGSEGDFVITVTEDDPTPVNDNCGTADIVLATGANTGLTNACSTMEVGETAGSCGAGPDEATVWYTYDVTTDIQDVTITLAPGTITNQTIVAYDACLGTVLEEDCGGTEIIIDCPANGMTIWVQVGSPSADDGSFDLTVTEGDPIIVNDLCTGAIDVSPAVACIPETVNATTMDACPESDATFMPTTFGSTCTFDMDATSWYTFTTGALTTDVVIENITNGATLTIFDACVPGAIIEDCIGANTTTAITASTQYWIAATIPTTEGPFDFDITFIEPPANDDCANADPLSVGANTGLSNECSTMETGETDGTCGAGAEEATVWYTYDITTDIQDITITLAPGDVANQTLVTYDACLGTVIEEDCAGTEVVIDCPVNPMTIWIQVGSASVDDGTFDITITEGPAKIANDECDMPVDISPTMPCVFETMAGTTIDMCPEVDGGGDPTNFGSACMFDMDATSWYTVTTTANTTAIEFDNFTGGVSFTVFENACPPTTIVGGGDCISAFTNVPVAAGTYLIAATSNPEADFTVDIKLIEAPDNDVCTATAEVLTIGGTLAGETTECASGDITGACNPAATSTVFYSFTAATDLNEITIDVTNFGGGTDDFSLFVLDGDCTSSTFLNQFDFSAGDYCGASGTELLKFSCLMAGDVITIVVASDPLNEGTFDITINETVEPACLVSDDCADAVDMGEIETDDPTAPECITSCNTLACPDDEIDALCGGTVFNATFFTFTTDADPLLTDGITDIFMQASLDNSTIANPVIMVLEGSCGSLALFSTFGCTVGDDTTPINVQGDVMPNTTYTVVVGTTDNIGGDFDLCVQISSGCVNDECADAIILDDGVTLMSQNTGCTMDATSYGCGTDEASSAWYSFTMPAGTSTMTIDISPSTDFSIQVFEVNCPPTAGDILDDGEFCTTDGSEELFCLQENTEYYIQISTAVGVEQTFDITITGTPSSDPPNDLCSMAEPLDFTDCEWKTICFNNTMACPEGFTNCGADVDPTVWFTITLPPMGYGVEFANFDDPDSWGIVFADDVCPPTTFEAPDCFGGTPSTVFSTLVENTTYNIAFGNPSEGGWCLDFKVLVAPLADDPCDTWNGNGPVDISGGGFSGTTCCAQDKTDGDDYANQDCSGATDFDKLWFMYQTNPADDGYVIEVTGTSDLGVEVLTGSATAGCDGAFDELLGSSCTGNASIEIANCVDDQILWISVGNGNGDDDCGVININVTPANCSAPMADTCDDDDIVIFNPATDLNGEFQFECEPGCLTYACPETDVADCGFGNIPTVWFQVTTDLDAAQIYFNVETACGWDPVFALYEVDGGACPADLSIVATAATPGCNTGWGDPSQINQPVQPETDYWIAVGANNFEPGMCGDFTLCVTTTITQIICLGDGSCTPASMNETTDEEGEIIDPAVDKLCQGTTVMICETFFYDASETGVDWLIGIVPFFDGWDMTDFDPEAVVVTGNGQTGVWFEENILQEQVNTLCTYMDDEGVLQLCNILCGTCPCTPPMPAGSIMPGGWYWVSNGGNAGCDNDGTPGEGWGIGSTTANVDFCLELKTPVYEDPADCLANKILRFGFQTFSDGVAGCWEDPVGECLLDEAQFKLYELECDAPPAIQGGPTEICTGDMAGLDLETADGSNVDFNVTFCDNPNVSGEMDHMFTGTGTVNDVLTINPGITTPQIVIYKSQAIVPGLECPGPIIEHEVTVYPEILVTFSPPYFVCFDGQGDSQITIEPTVTGGTGTGYVYSWDDLAGSSTSSITVPENLPATPGDYVYCVTVTDALGCEGSECTFITVLPPLDWALQGDTELCWDGINPTVNSEFAVITAFVVDPNNTTPLPFSGGLEWCVEDVDGHGGDLEDLFGIDGEFWVDEENSDPGCYDITLKVEDIYGCEQETDPWRICLSEGPEFEILSEFCDQNGTTVEFEGQPFQDVIISICDEDGNVVGGPYFGGDEFIFTEPGNYSFKIDYSNPDIECITTVPYEVLGPLTPIFDVPGVCIGEDAIATLTNTTEITGILWGTPGVSGDTGWTIPTLTVNDTLLIEYTDINGCVGFGEVIFTVSPNPMPSIEGPTQLCAGSMATYSISGLDPAVTYTYEWSPGGEVTSSIMPTVNADIQYCVTVTSPEGCEGTDCIDVETASEIVLSPFSMTICEDETILIGVDPSFTNVVWSTTEVTDSITVSPSGTAYTVTFTNADDCPGTGEFTITGDPLQFADVTETVEVCNASGFPTSTIVNFNNETGSSDAGSWSDIGFAFSGTFDPANSDFDGFAAATYKFVYTTNAGGSQCPPVTDTLCVVVAECACPEIQVQSLGDICVSGPDTISILNLGIPFDGATWSFNGASSNMTIINDELLTFDESTTEGFYTLVYQFDPPDPGCDADPMEVTFNLYQQPTLTISPTSGTACNEATGNGDICLDFTGVAVGSTPGSWSAPVTFTNAWDPNDVTSVCFDGLDIGSTHVFTYLVNPSDPNSTCDPVSGEYTITVLDCDCGNPVTLDPPSFCNSGGSLFMNDYIGSADPGGWTLTNAFGGGDINTIGFSVVTSEVTIDGNTDAGLYEFTYTLNPPFGGDCDDDHTVTVTVLQAPFAAFLNDTLACSEVPVSATDYNNIIDISSLLDPSSASGLYSASDPLIDAQVSVDATSVDFAGLAIGTVVTISYTTNTATVPCVDITTTMEVTVVDCDCPPVSLTNPDPACNVAGTVDLCSSVNSITGSGDWTLTDASNGGDIATIILTGCEAAITDATAPGTYEFTYTLNPPPPDGCITSNTVELIVNEAPVAVLMDTSACSVVPMSATDLSNVLNLAFLLEFGSSPGTFTSDEPTISAQIAIDPTSVDFAGLPIGTVVTITYTTNTAVAPCQDLVVSCTVTVVDCDCPFISLGTLDDVCNVAGSVDLCAAVNAGSAPGDWTVTDATNGGVINTISVTGCTANVTVATVPGTYEFTYTLNPAAPDGCTPSDVITLNVIPAISAGSVSGSSTYCEYESATDILADLIAGEDMGGVWTESSNPLSTGAAFDAAAGTFTMDGQLPGTYTFVYSFDANGPCPGDSEEVMIIVEAEPEANAGNDGMLTCTDLFVVLGDANGTSTGDVTYTWYDENGNVLQNGPDLLYETNSNGTFTLEVTDNITGCTIQDEVTVGQDPNVPSFEAVAEGFPCFGDNSGMIVIDGAQNGNAPYTVYISGDLDTTFILSDPSMIDNLPSGNYSIYIEDDQGCPSPVQNLIIAQPEPFVITDVPDNDNVEFGTTYQVSINEFINPDSISMATWTVDGDIVCEAPPMTLMECDSILVLVDRAVEVCITLVNNQGCEDTDCLWLRTKLINDVYTPNVFSPDAGGEDVYVFPQTSEFGEIVNYFRIFDRWGELIFENENFAPNVASEGWDGTYGGEPAVQGVYIYQFEVVFQNGEVRRIAKDVTLIR